MIDGREPIDVERQLEELITQEEKSIQNLYEAIKYKTGLIDGYKVAQEVMDTLIEFYVPIMEDLQQQNAELHAKLLPQGKKFKEIVTKKEIEEYDDNAYCGDCLQVECVCEDPGPIENWFDPNNEFEDWLNVVRGRTVDMDGTLIIEEEGESTDPDETIRLSEFIERYPNVYIDFQGDDDYQQFNIDGKEVGVFSDVKYDEMLKSAAHNQALGELTKEEYEIVFTMSKDEAEQLQKSCEELANDEEYQKECAEWMNAPMGPYQEPERVTSDGMKITVIDGKDYVVIPAIENVPVEEWEELANHHPRENLFKLLHGRYPTPEEFEKLMKEDDEEGEEPNGSH